jgi:hypothetical protein
MHITLDRRLKDIYSFEVFYISLRSNLWTESELKSDWSVENIASWDWDYFADPYPKVIILPHCDGKSNKITAAMLLLYQRCRHCNGDFRSTLTSILWTLLVSFSFLQRTIFILLHLYNLQQATISLLFVKQNSKIILPTPVSPKITILIYFAIASSFLY